MSGAIDGGRSERANLPNPGRMNDPVVDRRFLGWDRPILHSAVDHLVRAVESTRPMDLSRFLVVLPGGRAGRRLKELLVDRDDSASRPLRPPQVTTVGRLPEELYRPELPAPDPVLDRLAWRGAFQALGRDEIQTLALVPDEQGPAEAISLLSGLAGVLQHQVGAAGMSFGDVAVLLEGSRPFSDRLRWEVLAKAQEAYRAILTRHGFRDLASSRRIAISDGRIATTKGVWIVGAPDVPPVVKKFLGALETEEPIRVLVGAPADLHECFDALGCVIPERWSDIRAEIPEGCIHVVQRPDDQADAVIRQLRDLNGQVPAEQITVAVPDPEVVPYLTERLAEVGVKVRDAQGTPLPRTAPFRLLIDVERYLSDPDFLGLGTLVRHPFVEVALRTKMEEPPTSLVGVLDRYQTFHLQAGVGDGPFPSGGERASDPLQPVVLDAHGTLERILSPLSGERLLSEWSPRLAQVLTELLSGQSPASARSPAARELKAFAEEAGLVLDRFSGLPSELDSTVSAAQALRTLAEQLKDSVVPPDPEEGAIELLGWLELPLDDAAVMMLTGVNEPYVPESVTSDPFLPHSLRETLGLLDNTGRWARDLLYLRTILQTRRPESDGLPSPALIAGRWDGEGNPLLPSRLLFAEAPETLALRVKRCFAEEDAEEAFPPRPHEALTRENRSGDAIDRQRRVDSTAAEGPMQGILELDFTPRPGRGFQLPPEPVIHADEELDRISVTAFRAFLTDPYKYALERVLRLRRIHDRAPELDGLSFGTLAHDVLDRFGRGPGSGSDEPRDVRRFLERHLEREANDRFGARPLPAVRLQIEQLRSRLFAFAEWQAAWVRMGWRIQRTEASPPGGGVELIVDGHPILLTGKLDRVDYNEGADRWCVLDYKTGERVSTPEVSHRRGPNSRRQWIDLQLPLYRLLAAGLEDDEGAPLIPEDERRQILLGYVPVSRDLRVRELLAGWSPSELDEAEEVAREVVRKLRVNRFAFVPERSTVRPREDVAAILGGDVIRGLEEGGHASGE